MSNDTILRLPLPEVYGDEHPDHLPFGVVCQSNAYGVELVVRLGAGAADTRIGEIHVEQIHGEVKVYVWAEGNLDGEPTHIITLSHA